MSNWFLVSVATLSYLTIGVGFTAIVQAAFAREKDRVAIAKMAGEIASVKKELPLKVVVTEYDRRFSWTSQCPRCRKVDNHEIASWLRKGVIRKCVCGFAWGQE